MPPFLLLRLTVAVLAVALYATGSWYFRRKARQIARSRPRDSAEAYLSLFRDQTAPKEIALAVYSYLQNWMTGAVERFPVRPDDHIADVYGIVHEDLDSLVQEMLRKFNRRWPTEECAVSVARVETVEHVVHFIARAPLTDSG